MKSNHSNKVFQISVHSIKPNSNQPRHLFNQDMLKELAESIHTYGLLQPISIRKINTNDYELVAGERRLRAVKLLGMEMISAIIINVTEEDSAILALIENLQRENLNYMEEAMGYQQLMKEFNLKQQILAQQLGKNQSTIANKLRLLKLPASVRKVLLTSFLSERHARALLKLSSEEKQLIAINKVIKNNWTVSRTEKYIKEQLDKNTEKEIPNDASLIKGYFRDIRLFTNTIKQVVSMAQETGINADYQIKEADNFYEISIKIPIEN